MEMDPHTFQQIIRRIEQQMRCPQCGKRMPVEFPAVRMAGDEFVLMQLHCETCEAYIVLNASLQTAQVYRMNPAGQVVNASSTLQLKDEDVAALRKALEQSGGSFEKMFKKTEPAAGTQGTMIA